MNSWEKITGQSFVGMTYVPIPSLPTVPFFYIDYVILFFYFAVFHDVQTQPIGVKEKFVPAAVLLENCRYATGSLNFLEFDVGLGLFDGVTDEFSRARFSLGSDNHGLFLLAGFVDDEGGTLGFLLGNLFGFHSGGELRREGQVLLNRVSLSCFLIRKPSTNTETYCQGDIVQQNVEPRRSYH